MCQNNKEKLKRVSWAVLNIESGEKNLSKLNWLQHICQEQEIGLENRTQKGMFNEKGQPLHFLMVNSLILTTYYEMGHVMLFATFWKSSNIFWSIEFQK